MKIDILHIDRTCAPGAALQVGLLFPLMTALDFPFEEDSLLHNLWVMFDPEQTGGVMADEAP